MMSTVQQKFYHLLCGPTECQPLPQQPYIARRVPGIQRLKRLGAVKTKAMQRRKGKYPLCLEHLWHIAEAYQKVAYLIEGLEPPVAGRQLQ